MQENSPRERDHHVLAAGFVNQRINSLSKITNESAAKASLARLRRGAGKVPGSMPEVYEETFPGMPEALAGTSPLPSFGEWAIHIALTLFALHQQGKDLAKENMYQKGQGLGRAVRLLIKKEEDENRIKRRFDQVLTANSPEEISHYLRGLVQLLRAAGIPLDYSALCKDLFFVQIPEARDGVRLAWGRDFYAATFTQGQTDDQEDKEEEEEEEGDHQDEEQ